MPPDKWQMIIDPDSTETTHLSNRYTRHKHAVDVSLCVCTAKVHLCICSYWQLPHWEEVMPFVPLAVICDDICAWWNLYTPGLMADDIVFSGCPSHSCEYLWRTLREFLPGLKYKMIIFWWTNTIVQKHIFPSPFFNTITREQKERL